MSNQDLSVAELARVTERQDVDQWYTGRDCQPLREFDATCADGSVCHITAGGMFMEGHCFCELHDANNCEGCVRVGCVLTDEKLKSELLSVLGFTLNGCDNRNDAAIETQPILTLEKSA